MRVTREHLTWNSKHVCREKVEIPATMAYITLEGAGADNTIIVWDDTADRMGQSGHPLGTFGSATFAVDAPYFIAKNITFKVSHFHVFWLFRICKNQ